MSTLKVSAVTDSSGNSLLPLPGTVMFFASSTSPSGWIKCNGASLSTTTYSNLFSAIGYSFGGSGASFNVPDLRGEFVRGWDDSRGIDSGRSFGSFQSATRIGHMATFGGDIAISDADELIPTSRTKNSITNNFTATRNDSTVRPRNIALLACIKF